MSLVESLVLHLCCRVRQIKLVVFEGHYMSSSFAIITVNDSIPQQKFLLNVKHRYKMLAANLTLMIRYKEWVKKTRMDLSAKMDEEKELSNKGSLRRKIVK